MELRSIGEAGFTGSIGLESQDADADQKSYVRTMNRIAKSGGDRGSYVLAIIYAVVVVVFAVVMWGIRHTEMMSSETEASAAMGQTSISSSPFPPAAPASMTDAQGAVDKVAAGESAKGKNMSADLAFGVFSLIFLLTQGVGFLGAFTHTFSGGRNSAGAYKNTKGFMSYDDYKVTYQPYIDAIDAELKAFQAQLKMSGRIDRNYEKTFSDYLTLEAAISIEEAKEKIDSLNTADAVAYIKSLPANIQIDLKPWLLERKAKREEAEKAKNSGLSDQDLENLL
jgi:hypothetical protein